MQVVWDWLRPDDAEMGLAARTGIQMLVHGISRNLVFAVEEGRTAYCLCCGSPKRFRGPNNDGSALIWKGRTLLWSKLMIVIPTESRRFIVDLSVLNTSSSRGHSNRKERHPTIRSAFEWVLLWSERSR